MSVAKGLFKNAAWLSFGLVTSKVIRAGFLIVAARYLGVSQYGVVSYALAQAGIFTALADCGLVQLAMRECARGTPESRRRVANIGFFTKLILIGATSLMLIATMHLSSQAVPLSLEIILLVTFIFAFDSMRDYTAGILIALEKNKTEAYINIVSNALPLIVGFPFLVVFPTPAVFLYVYVISSFASVALHAVIVHRSIIFSRVGISIKNCISIIKESYLFGLHGITLLLMFGMDIILIGIFKSEHDVGLYSAVQRIPVLLMLLPGFVAQGFFPEISRTAFTDREQTARLITKALTFLLLIGLPIVIGGIITGDTLIMWLLGSEYTSSIPIFQILIGSVLFTFPSSLYTLGLYAYNKQKNVVQINTIIGVSTVILNCIAIPLWGIMGSGVVLLIMQILQNLLLKRSLQKEITVMSEIPLVETTAATALLILGILGLESLNIHVSLVVCGSGALYALTLYSSFKKLIHS